MKTQRVIAEETGCSQSSVSKLNNRKSSGRKKCGKNRRNREKPSEDCQTNSISDFGEESQREAGIGAAVTMVFLFLNIVRNNILIL